MASSRVPLFERLPRVWHRLDVEGTLDKFLNVVDDGFDHSHAFSEGLFDLRSVDKIPDKWLMFIGDTVGHVWNSGKSKAWNRTRIRNAIRRHSYKGTINRLTDDLIALDANGVVVDDNAQYLLTWSTQGSWSENDAILETDKFWHDGAFVITVVDNSAPRIVRPDIEAAMRLTVPAGTIWYISFGKQWLWWFESLAYFNHGQMLQYGNTNDLMLGHGVFADSDFIDNELSWSWQYERGVHKGFYPIVWHTDGNTHEYFLGHGLWGYFDLSWDSNSQPYKNYYPVVWHWDNSITSAISPAARYYCTSTIYDDYMYIFGGDSGNYRNDLHRLDLTTSNWSGALISTGTAPTARYGHTSVIHSDHIYVLGGITSTPQNDLHRLDLTTLTWSGVLSPTGTAPTARYGHTSVVHGNYMYVFGGWDANTLNDIHRLDLTTLTWSGALSPTGTPPTARKNHSAVIYGNYMYVFGGTTRGYQNSYQNDLHRLDLTTLTWSGVLSPTGTAPTARYGHTSVVHGNYMYVFGGWDANTLNDIHRLDLDTLTWSGALNPTGTPPDARRVHSSVIYENYMYVFGGDAQEPSIFSYLDGGPVTSIPDTCHNYGTILIPDDETLAFGVTLPSVSYQNDLHRLDLTTLTWSGVLSTVDCFLSRTCHRFPFALFEALFARYCSGLFPKGVIFDLINSTFHTQYLRYENDETDAFSGQQLTEWAQRLATMGGYLTGESNLPANIDIVLVDEGTVESPMVEAHAALQQKPSKFSHLDGGPVTSIPDTCHNYGTILIPDDETLAFGVTLP